MKYKFLKIFLLISFIILIFCGSILVKRGYLAYVKFSELKDIKHQTDALRTDNDNLRLQIEYFKNPVNLEKEARSALNYRKPGEKMAIIVSEIKNNESSSTDSQSGFWKGLFNKIF